MSDETYSTTIDVQPNKPISKTEQDQKRIRHVIRTLSGDTETEIRKTLVVHQTT